MKIYLGLGSNLKNKKEILEGAIQRLVVELKPTEFRISPIYETPALLPANADSSWNLPYLNLVAEFECDVFLETLFSLTQRIEKDFGRVRSERWAPRELDIDILLFGNEKINDNHLVIPHSQIYKRSFVLDPLKDLVPQLKIEKEKNSVLNQARKLKQHAPVWMGIMNLTPDSFSDGGLVNRFEEFKKQLIYFDSLNLGIIDIGAESTRPGAEIISVDEEWNRLQEALIFSKDYYKDRFIKPQISLDTRNIKTAVQGLEHGVDIINDVSGLSNLEMIDVLKTFECDYVLMHSLSVPADTKVVFSDPADVIEELKKWFSQKLEILFSKGVKKEKIILDLGIGFGKTALQSQILLESLHEFFDFDQRILVGHSRKSFLKNFSPSSASDRDLESVGVSLSLIEKGVDILRVHNPEMHLRAFSGWKHVRK